MKIVGREFVFVLCGGVEYYEVRAAKQSCRDASLNTKDFEGHDALHPSNIGMRKFLYKILRGKKQQ